MGAIKCHVGGRVYRVVFLIPPDLLPGYHAVWITLADDLEDGFTVEPRRLTAGRCLQMMRKTTGSREIFLAKRTRDIGATMDFGVEMRLQIVLTHETPLTFSAVVSVVAQVLHMFIRGALRMEFLRARLTRDFRRPVPKARHVLVCRILRPKFSGASLTFKAWCPVIHVAHVLVTGTPALECTRTGFASRPVVVFIHMAVSIILRPENVRAGEAFPVVVHCHRAYRMH